MEGEPSDRRPRYDPSKSNVLCNVLAPTCVASTSMLAAAMPPNAHPLPEKNTCRYTEFSRSLSERKPSLSCHVRCTKGRRLSARNSCLSGPETSAKILFRGRSVANALCKLVWRLGACVLNSQRSESTTFGGRSGSGPCRRKPELA